MNVTQEIQQNHIVYGASDYTAPGGLSASKSLNYAKGPSITEPDNTNVSVIPYSIRYADTVGLFGAENYFLKVDIAITAQVAAACFAEEGWECAFINYNNPDLSPDYEAASMNLEDPPEENTYFAANIVENKLPVVPDGYISISLENIKSNNRFIDDWLDVRLYTQDKEEHPYDKMYMKGLGHFYIGVHARNTKRLPYDILCEIGREYRTYSTIADKRLIMKRHLQ